MRAIYQDENAAAAQQQLVAARAEWDAPYTYFNERFNEHDGILAPVVKAFRAARILDPGAVCSMQPDEARVRTLTHFPFIHEADIAPLLEELPTYLAAASGVDSDIDILPWWRTHLNELPEFGKVVRLVLHVCPSSAAAERVFSLFAHAFGDEQEHALEDYMETSVRLRYNNRGARGERGLVVG